MDFVLHRSVMDKTTAVLLDVQKDQELLILETLVKLQRKATKTVHNKGSNHSYILIS